MGRDLAHGFEKRQVADYEYNQPIARREASELLAKAESFVDSVRRYLQPPKR